MTTQLITGDLSGRKYTAIGLILDNYIMCQQNKEEFKTKVFSNVKIPIIHYLSLESITKENIIDVHDCTVIIEIKDEKDSKLRELTLLLLLEHKERNLDLTIIMKQFDFDFLGFRRYIERILICKYNSKDKMCSFVLINPIKQTQKNIKYSIEFYREYIKKNKTREEV